MRCSLAVIGGCLVALVACHETGGPSSSIQSPGAPSAVTAATPERPWKGHFDWAVTRLEWADPQAPFSGATSRFNGRCSVPSDYVIYATFDGEATHVGHITGEGSHCSQLHMTPTGPGSVTYSDGRGTLLAANGSTLDMQWGDGTSGTDPATGVTWFRDRFTITGGTGLLAQATGGGEEGGTFTDFMALLGGKPAAMWQEGTIRY